VQRGCACRNAKPCERSNSRERKRERERDREIERERERERCSLIAHRETAFLRETETRIMPSSVGLNGERIGIDENSYKVAPRMAESVISSNQGVFICLTLIKLRLPARERANIPIDEEVARRRDISLSLSLSLSLFAIPCE